MILYGKNELAAYLERFVYRWLRYERQPLKAAVVQTVVRDLRMGKISPKPVFVSKRVKGVGVVFDQLLPDEHEAVQRFNQLCANNQSC